MQGAPGQPARGNELIVPNAFIINLLTYFTFDILKLFVIYYVEIASGFWAYIIFCMLQPTRHMHCAAVVL